MLTLASIVIGAHLHTTHFGGEADTPEAYRNRDSTPGLYLRTESGLTAGIVRNSLGRTSVYLGKTWESDSKRFALTLGAITGYKYRTVYGQNVCREDYTSTPDSPCAYRHGSTNGVLRPLVVPSVALPAIGGLTPRIALLGKGVHFAIERALP